jgi:hypothetical protein
LQFFIAKQCTHVLVIIIFSSSIFAQENFTSQNYLNEAVVAKMAEKEANKKVAAEAEAAKKTAEAESDNWLLTLLLNLPRRFTAVF